MPITVGKPIEIQGHTYLVKRLIGKGGLSRVYLGEDLSNHKKVAIKEFIYSRFYNPYTHENDCEEYWENEVLNTIAQSKSGLPVVEVLAYEARMDLQTPEFYIVLSYIEGETFLDFYRRFILKSGSLEHLDLSNIVRYIFIPLAQHLDYCHSKEYIVHRDFAVNNIIIQSERDEELGWETFWPVLIDWGVSKYVGPEWIYYTPKPYMTEDMPRDIPIQQKGAPPEIRNGYFPTAASDIYYLGHLMYFVFTGGIIREDSEIVTEEDYVLDAKRINWYLPDEYNDVIKHLTQFEPADRPKDMKEVIKLLKDLITIRHIHFDFELFCDPDTDEITGVIKEGKNEKEK